nr:hypothetical protein [Rhizobium sullae]
MATITDVSMNISDRSTLRRLHRVSYRARPVLHAWPVLRRSRSSCGKRERLPPKLGFKRGDHGFGHGKVAVLRQFLGKFMRTGIAHLQIHRLVHASLTSGHHIYQTET